MYFYDNINPMLVNKYKNNDDFVGFCMLYNIKHLSLHCVFHGIRFKVNEDWESVKIPFFVFCTFGKSLTVVFLI